MKKLKRVNWLYEILVLRLMGFHQGEYCDIWDQWLKSTLKGDFSFSDYGEHTVTLTNNSTGAARAVWICNHPYASICDYTYRSGGKNRASRAAVNLFVDKNNEYVSGKIKEQAKKYADELKA